MLNPEWVEDLTVVDSTANVLLLPKISNTSLALIASSGCASELRSPM